VPCHLLAVWFSSIGSVNSGNYDFIDLEFITLLLHYHKLSFFLKKNLFCERKGKKNQTSLVHRGLVVAIFFLCLFFILTGTIANVGNPTVCKITGSLLHYSLLSTLCWMAMEVFHTFLLVRKVFSSTPPWVFYLGGFGEYKHTFIYSF